MVSERAVASEPESACLDEVLPDSPGLVSGSFAEVVTNDLVLRNAPRVADDSKIRGTLDAPARVYVNAGPVNASGFEWWEVIPEGGNHDNAAWVAAAGKDGEEWLRPMRRREGTWTLIERRDVLGELPATGRVGTGADGRLYFFGGTDGAALEEQPIDQALAYDPVICEWDRLPPLPLAHHNGLHVAQTTDGMLHAIAAARTLSGDTTTSPHLVFDPATQRWEEREAFPAVVDDGSDIVADGDGRLWAFGNEIHRYDEADDSWIRVPTPTPWTQGVDSATLLRDGSLALLFSGAGGIWRFDPDRNATSLIAKPRVARYNARMVELDDGTIVVGGGYLTGSCTSSEQFPPEIPPSPHYSLFDTYSPATGRWLSIVPPRLGAVELVPVVADGVLYVIGLEERWNASGSDPFREKADLVIARFTPADASAGHPAEPGAGGCGG